jgi:hypothetical protein
MCLTASVQLNAQNCIDTVHIKGYYVIKRLADEIGPKITRSGNVTTVENNIDTHDDPSFIPSDSINKNHLLSYWLNHFFHDTRQVFISCEKFSAKDFLEKSCLQKLNKDVDTCQFPFFQTGVFYKTTNLNTGDVFEIYFIDAYWTKIKIRKGSLEADMIPGKIAQRCISPEAKEFSLYCFIKCNGVQKRPLIKDPHIIIWKR